MMLRWGWLAASSAVMRPGARALDQAVVLGDLLEGAAPVAVRPRVAHAGPPGCGAPGRHRHDRGESDEGGAQPAARVLGRAGNRVGGGDARPMRRGWDGSARCRQGLEGERAEATSLPRWPPIPWRPRGGGRRLTSRPVRLISARASVGGARGPEGRHRWPPARGTGRRRHASSTVLPTWEAVALPHDHRADTWPGSGSAVAEPEVLHEDLRSAGPRGCGSGLLGVVEGDLSTRRRDRR